MEATDLAYQLNENSSDRLGFGFFVAAILHAFIVFGIVIESERVQSSLADLEITLVTHFSEDKPVDADFWAQQNQQASGTKEEVHMLTSTDNTAAEGANEFSGEQDRQSQVARESSGAQVVATSGASENRVPIAPDVVEEQQSELSEEMARREAIQGRLDALQQEYARRPKIGTLTSVSAKAREDAEYQLHLQDRIVKNGNINYPAEALQKGIYGSLRLMLTILPDGTLESIEILESSGERILDQAAIEIANASAPFFAFPPETARRYDKILFIRTWQFLRGGTLSTSE